MKKLGTGPNRLSHPLSRPFEILRFSLADPIEQPGSEVPPRFVEIFNLECFAVNLAGYQIRRFTDSSSQADVRSKKGGRGGIVN